MTGQISDEVTYRGKPYALTGANGTGLFDPASLGLRVRMISTACWRGYVAGYAVLDDALKLTRLELGLDDRPEVFGVRPDEPHDPEEAEDSENFLPPPRHPAYSGLDVPVPFTGGLLIGRDFDSSYYVHMGYQAGWKYEDLQELIFEDGRLVEAHDRSRTAARMREAAEGPESPDRNDREAVRAWIRRSFSLDYDPLS
ncbi:hypothetical protein GCM10010191_61650 [Actinomadura vinacea]|uniref:Uncharacterized protein n=1 Tax=Actinomadura vinacea TaxID=115336 RepID=A0ABN3JRW3_9ACTN